MKSLQKSGGIAAIIHSAAYLMGIGLYLTILSPILDAEPGKYLALLIDYKSLMFIWILIAYWIAGFCLIIVSLALYDWLKGGSPALMQVATVLGLIWAGLIIASGNLMLHNFGEMANLYGKEPAQAQTVWVALKSVENGIVSGNELIGGLWILLLSWAASQTNRLNKSLNYFGLVIGIAGVISIVPILNEAAVMIFGLSMILWFAWVGFILLRENSKAAE
ncbi:MAG TPA: DUF4386 family protein [Ignavibacteriaceae bacterium]|nr:DUF4386 family protein [Ignavibacteriaceae bacterium]